MNRREAIAKAVEYMNDTFGPVRQSDNQDQWHERLGMLVDFIGKMFDDDRPNARCLRFNDDCTHPKDGGCFGGNLSCYVPPNTSTLKAPFAPTPPDGYRLLRVGELVREDDLYFMPTPCYPSASMDWRRVGMKSVHGAVYDKSWSGAFYATPKEP